MTISNSHFCAVRNVWEPLHNGGTCPLIYSIFLYLTHSLFISSICKVQHAHRRLSEKHTFSDTSTLIMQIRMFDAYGISLQDDPDGWDRVQQNRSLVSIKDSCVAPFPLETSEAAANQSSWIQWLDSERVRSHWWKRLSCKLSTAFPFFFFFFFLRPFFSTPLRYFFVLSLSCSLPFICVSCTKASSSLTIWWPIRDVRF